VAGRDRHDQRATGRPGSRLRRVHRPLRAPGRGLGMDALCIGTELEGTTHREATGAASSRRCAARTTAPRLRGQLERRVRAGRLLGRARLRGRPGVLPLSAEARLGRRAGRRLGAHVARMARSRGARQTRAPHRDRYKASDRATSSRGRDDERPLQRRRAGPRLRGRGARAVVAAVVHRFYWWKWFPPAPEAEAATCTSPPGQPARRSCRMYGPASRIEPKSRFSIQPCQLTFRSYSIAGHDWISVPSSLVGRKGARTRLDPPEDSCASPSAP